jgi:hypothetical protein
MSERRDGDRIVVSGVSAGSHFPREQALIEYDWEADGLGPEGPFDIEGSVYGKNVRLKGPGTLRGTLLGRGDVRLEPGDGKPQRLLSGVAASGSLLMPEWAVPLSETTFGGIERARLVVKGDVLGENVVLDGAVVFGNVEATRIRLSHCVVIGSVVARETLTVRASSLLAYHAGSVSFEGPCSLMHALGESRTLPVFVPYRDLDGTLRPASVQLYPLVRGTGSFFNRSGPEGDAARLSPAHDWVRVVGDDGSEGVALSIMGRALDLRGFAKAVKDVSEILRTALEFDHYGPRDRERIRARWAQVATPEELWVLEQSIGRPGASASAA